MKLDIEAMMKQTLGPEPVAYFEFYKDELESFARLIVERCAYACESEAGWTNNADVFAAKIRSILGD